MDNTELTRISITPTVARQTPNNQFGQVLSNTLSGAISAGGSLLGGMPGMPIISSAVSAVSSIAHGGVTRSTTAASGAINTGAASVSPSSSPGIGGLGGSSDSASRVTRAALNDVLEPSGMNDLISGMRAEADRSMLMQMQMQTESREYNTLTNILKLRHDSAKAAINNIR